MVFTQFFTHFFRDPQPIRRIYIEELADLLELIYAVLPLHDSSMEELEKVRLAKREKRGGFDKGYYLIEVEDD